MLTVQTFDINQPSVGASHVTPADNRFRLHLFLFCAILIVIINTGYYFAVHLPTFNAQYREVRPYRDVEDAVLRGARFPDGTMIHLITGYTFDNNYSRQFLEFLDDGQRIETWINHDMPPDAIASLDDSVPRVFYVVPDDAATINQIQQHFSVTGPTMSDAPYIPADEQYAEYITQGAPQPDVRVVDTAARQRREVQIISVGLLLAGIALFGGWRYNRRR